MNFEVRRAADGLICLYAGATKMRCAVGRGGISRDKLEGDGTTPVGTFPLRRIFYRADRLPRPETALPTRALEPDDGWCEVPGDVNYNRLVKMPYAGRDERMWRQDHLYDVVIELGYNDDPVVAGKGSAIFLHLARTNYQPSSGCVTLSLDDMQALLPLCDLGSKITIEG
jgi:L,D-peptidoglycan transpeptidase YkuD (ErfK/YbiS/YcfS/YnhG family)